MANRPYLSAIITVFNGERYLQEAIGSLTGQTFEDFEVVVVNDGSTDGTGKVIQQCMSLDKRIRLVELPHVGRVEALNIACGAARGKFVAILDADDVALPERFELQAAFLRLHPDVALLGSGVVKMNSEGRPFATVIFPTGDAELRKQLSRQGCFAHSTVVMSSDAVASVGGYRRAFPPAEDYDLWLRLAERFQIANLPQALVKYRVHLDQVSSTFVERHTVAVLAAQTAARLRRETGFDPTDHLERITVGFLTSNGVNESDIHRAIVDAYLSNSLTFWISGARELSIDTLNKALEWALQAGCDPVTVAPIHTLRASRYMRNRRPLKALGALARSYKSNPDEVKALFRRVLHRAHSRTTSVGLTG